MTFEILTFNQLSTQTLYDILDLRNRVFVVEQNCVYLDTDGKDFSSVHLLLRDKNKLIAYCRILPKGLAYDEFVSVGRVLTSPEVRSKGAGRSLMREALKQV